MSGAPASKSALGGVGLTLAAVALFASLDTATKLVLTTVPLMMALWFRYFVQAVATTVIMLPKRGWRMGQTRRPALHLLRGLLLVGSSLAAFTALQHIPVAEFTAIVALSPLVVTVLTALLFGERVSIARWLLVLGGFGGALIIIRPGAQSFSAMMLLPLLVLAANSSFQLLTSRMVRSEDPMTMHLYTGWIGTLVASLALPWVWRELSWLEWGRMMVMGLSAAIGHFLLILAYGRTTAAVMGPYLYAQIAFAVLGGWLVFSHTPDGWALLGMCVIGLCGASGAWLILRQSRLERAAPAVPLA